jgi:cytochrome c6
MGEIMKTKTGQRSRVLPLLCTILFLASAGTPLSAEDAAGLYKSKCAACHGADGTGTPTGKKLGTHDFASPDVQKMSDDDLAKAIADGKGKMPGYKKSLSDQQVKDLVAYVRSLAKK